MIEINLLPGDGKKKRRAKTTSSMKFEFHPSQWFAGHNRKDYRQVPARRHRRCGRFRTSDRVDVHQPDCPGEQCSRRARRRR